MDVSAAAWIARSGLLRFGSGLLAASPPSGLDDFHKVEGLVLLGGWLALAVYGAVLWGIKREAGRVYYLLLRGLEALLLVQAATGVALLATGGSRPLLHYGYGGVFPLVLLGIAEVLSRGLEKPPLHAFYTIAAFVMFGLMLRAYMTGASG